MAFEEICTLVKVFDIIIAKDDCTFPTFMKILYLFLLHLNVILFCMENVDNPNFIPLFKDTEDDKIVSNRIFAIPFELQQGIVA